MIALMMTLSLAGHAAVDGPRSTSKTSIHLVRQDPVFGGGSRLMVEIDRYSDVTVHVLARSASPRREIRRVIPEARANRVAREMTNWFEKIGASKGGLDETGCLRPARAERANVRAALCLDALSPADRQRFFAWYRRTAELVR